MVVVSQLESAEHLRLRLAAPSRSHLVVSLGSASSDESLCLESLEFNSIRTCLDRDLHQPDGLLKAALDGL